MDAFVQEAHHEQIDTAFVSLDNIKRSSSNDVTVMEEAMHSFGAVLPELDQFFAEEQEIYQALAFSIKHMMGSSLHMIKFDLSAGMRTV